MPKFDFAEWLKQDEMTSAASVGGGSFSNCIAGFARPLFSAPFERDWADDGKKRKKKRLREVFNTPPIDVDWGDDGLTQKRILPWKEPIKLPMPPRFSKEGKFKVGDETYKIHLHFSNAENNYLVRKTVKRNDLHSIAENAANMKVVEVGFCRVKGDKDCSYGIEGTGNATLVFKSVMNGIKSVISDYPVDMIVFKSQGRDEGRTRLYHTLVKRFGDGYSLLPVRDEHVFILIKEEHMKGILAKYTPPPIKNRVRTRQNAIPTD